MKVSLLGMLILFCGVLAQANSLATIPFRCGLSRPAKSLPITINGQINGSQQKLIYSSGVSTQPNLEGLDISAQMPFSAGPLKVVMTIKQGSEIQTIGTLFSDRNGALIDYKDSALHIVCTFL